jgi:hypothetical protein
MQGWIQLHRSFLEWEWYECPNTSRLFIHCLLKANHKDKNWRGIAIKRGSFLSSRESLSIETGLSPQNIRTCINKLKSTGELTSKSTSKSTMITICKYDTYQNLSNPTNQQLTSESPSNQPATNQRLTTTNNDNNINNDKKETFEIFRKQYLGKKRGLDTEFNNFIKKHKDWEKVLPELKSLLDCQINIYKAKKANNIFAPEWKNLQTWINQRCWEDEETEPDLIKPQKPRDISGIPQAGKLYL